MEKIIYSGKTYGHYEYQLEQEFEKVISEQAHHIFGAQSVYIDIKRRIGDSIMTIPDGYLIDFSFANDPKLYIIENELASHDPYKHIGSQLLKFAISYKASGRKIKAFLLEHIEADPKLSSKVRKGLKTAGYRNIDDLLESLIFEKTVAAIVIIDRNTEELENVLSQLTIDTDILELQTFVNGRDHIHKFVPFNGEIREVSEMKNNTLKTDELDTVVVPAREEGFEQVFLKQNMWRAIRIHASMLDKIKYVAAYQVAPISAITHRAEVARIERWKDTNKYALYFKGKATKIKPVSLGKAGKGMAPQAPRYTSMAKLVKAKTLKEAF